MNKWLKIMKNYQKNKYAKNVKRIISYKKKVGS